MNSFKNCFSCSGDLRSAPGGLICDPCQLAYVHGIFHNYISKTYSNGYFVKGNYKSTTITWKLNFNLDVLTCDLRLRKGESAEYKEIFLPNNTPYNISKERIEMLLAYT